METPTRRTPRLVAPRATVATVATVTLLALAACGGGEQAASAGGDAVAAGDVPAAAAGAPAGALDADQAEDLVEDALRADSALAAFQLDADDEGERVVIEGIVATDAQRTLAAEIAGRAAPGVAIDNQVRVDAATARREAAEAAADEADDRIEDALEADPALRAFDLDADDEDGRVVLTGTVRTAAERQTAEDVARRTAPGVPLDNRIRVQ